MDEFSVLPIQIFNWTTRPQAEFLTNAAAAILILLAITFTLTGIAVYYRNKWQQKLDKMSEILKTELLNVSYGEKKALKNISISIPANDYSSNRTVGLWKVNLLRVFNRMNDFIKSCKITGDIYVENKKLIKNVVVEELRKK